MALVYLARHRLHGGLFAVKVLVDHLAQDPRIVARFEQEARMAATLASHPNIVPIFDIGSGAGAEVLRKLLDTSDVLIDGTSPGTLERLGFGYPELSSRNPRLVYGALTGYGRKGPLGTGLRRQSRRGIGVRSFLGHGRRKSKIYRNHQKFTLARFRHV